MPRSMNPLYYDAAVANIRSAEKLIGEAARSLANRCDIKVFDLSDAAGVQIAALRIAVTEAEREGGDDG